MPIFIFDLDGTITSQETLPLIASHFAIESDIQELTNKTLTGNIPFIESFITRVNILGKLPVNEVATLLADVPIHPALHRFITTYQSQCVIATGNLNCWIHKLTEKIGCPCYHSEAEVINNRVAKLTTILKKEDVVAHYKRQGRTVVFIGDGNNDMEAMRNADIAIACGLTHYPAASVLTTAHYLVCNEDALCRLLHQLL